MDGQVFLALEEDVSGNLYAGGNDRMLFSDDNGNSWRPVSRVDPYFTDLLIDSNKILYAGLAGRGLFVSKDGGLTWEEKRTGLEKNAVIISMVINKEGYLVAGTREVGIYKSKRPVY